LNATDITFMKRLKKIIAIALTIPFLAAPLTLLAQDKEKKETKAKPYPLETCIVSGEKLGGMGKAFVFDYKGQEFKLCCKSCKKDFDKDPAKFVKKLNEEVAKAKKK
jgi:YHS domain-containing protein